MSAVTDHLQHLCAEVDSITATALVNDRGPLVSLKVMDAAASGARLAGIVREVKGLGRLAGTDPADQQYTILSGEAGHLVIMDVDGGQTSLVVSCLRQTHLGTLLVHMRRAAEQAARALSGLDTLDER